MVGGASTCLEGALGRGWSGYLDGVEGCASLWLEGEI